MGHITNGEFTHVAWIIKKNTGFWKIYKNGVYYTDSIKVFPTVNTYTYSYIGKSTWSTTEFDYDNQISLKDFRIYNKELYAYDIYILAGNNNSLVSNPNNAFYYSTTDMISWYKFENNFEDSSGNNYHNIYT